MNEPRGQMAVGGCGRVAGEVSWQCCRLLVCVAAPSGSSSSNSLATTQTMAAAVWVVAGRCAGDDNATVNSDASSLLYCFYGRPIGQAIIFSSCG